MMRKALRLALALALLSAGLFLVFGPRLADDAMNAVAPHEAWPVGDEARGLHATLVIGDWHADSTLWKRDFLRRNDRGHVDLPRLQDGNVAIQVLTSVTKSPRGLNVRENSAEAFDDITLLAIGQLWPFRTWTSLVERALYQARRVEDWDRASDDLRLLRSRTDLDALLAERAGGDRTVGVLLGIEGAHALEGDLANLDRLDRAGFRLVGLQHFFDNEVGGSLHGAGKAGLSPFGRAVVMEIERRGMILDVAHSSAAVIEDVLAMTDMPVVLSHGGIASHCPTGRNLPDALMRRIAATGGVLGVGYWRTAVCDTTPDGIAGAIVAAIGVMGEDHVSLGSDYDGTVRVAFDTSELAALTQALLDRGLSEPVIAKVMGGNLVRVMRARLH